MKILVADDHAVVRRGLKQILADAFQDAEIGEAASTQEAFDLVWKQEWDLVLLDITMPGRSGLDLLKDLKHHRPHLPVLILSVHPEEQYALRVLKAGAAGYLNKESAVEELVAAVKRVLAGGRYVSAALGEALATSVNASADRAAHENLSDREFEVLRLIASGKTVSEISVQLSLSVKTISTYRTRALAKMKMKTNAELMRYAVDHHLTDTAQ